MAQCVRTGAVVLFHEYGCVGRADLFEVGNIVVIQLGHSFEKSTTYDTNEIHQATHQVVIGPGWLHKGRGVAVVPREAIKEL